MCPALYTPGGHQSAWVGSTSYVTTASTYAGSPLIYSRDPESLSLNPSLDPKPYTLNPKP